MYNCIYFLKKFNNQSCYNIKITSIGWISFINWKIHIRVTDKSLLCAGVASGENRECGDVTRLSEKIELATALTLFRRRRPFVSLVFLRRKYLSMPSRNSATTKQFEFLSIQLFFFCNSIHKTCKQTVPTNTNCFLNYAFTTSKPFSSRSKNLTSNLLSQTAKEITKKKPKKKE